MSNTPKTMNLYLVQDGERPMHVVAASFADAVHLWRAQIHRENADEYSCADDPELTGPDGVTVIACGTDRESMPELLLPEASP